MTRRTRSFDEGMPLFAYEAYARKSDPATSHEAAAKLHPLNIADKELMALWAAGSRGDKGAAWFEAEEFLKGRVNLRQSISPRFKPLRRKGLVEHRYNEYGEKIKRINPASGTLQEVNFATPAGMAMLLTAGLLPHRG